MLLYALLKSKGNAYFIESLAFQLAELASELN